jgi:hypothetical protein
MVNQELARLHHQETAMCKWAMTMGGVGVSGESAQKPESQSQFHSTAQQNPKSRPKLKC